MSPSGTRPSRLAAAAGPPVAVLALALALWHGATAAFRVPAFLLPSPLAVAVAARDHAPDLLRAAALTGAAALCGFAASVVLGVAASLLFARAKWIERSLFPYALFLQTVPIVAVAPLIVIWFGTGFPSVVLVSFVLGVFPIVTATTAGLTSVDRDLHDLFRVYDATRGQVMVKLRLPHAVPHLVTGARTTAGLAVIGAVVGEFFAGFGARHHGLGYLIIVTSGQLRTDYLFAAIAASTGLGWLIFATVSAAGDAATRRWRDVS